MNTTRSHRVALGRPAVAADHEGNAGPSVPRTARGGTPALSIRARVSITPWTDLAFAAAVREILQKVRMSPEIDFGNGVGAVLAQRLLRERGYVHARVVDARDVDDAMRHAARWLVLRDG
jgi:hypothetical protein